MDDADLEVQGAIPTLLLFADIVESSKYSAVLGREEYARRLLEFQRLFKRMGKKYFPKTTDPVNEFCEVQARGDEGTVFFARSRGDFGEPLLRAIEFLYHLKGLLRFGEGHGEGESQAPTRIGLGAGIHVGKVAFATRLENNRSVIRRLEGFSINYAKRVESCSRRGKYSRIFLSGEAAKLLEDKPVVLTGACVPMKGIHEHAELYEVEGAFLGGLRIEPSKEMEDAQLVNGLADLADRPSEIEEPWEKALIVSVLDCLIEGTPVMARKAEYRDAQLRFAWHSSVEEDPILLYVRAKDFEDRKEYSQQLRYLKEIVEAHPDFVHARKRLIRACWGIAQEKPERSEVVFARDLAKEFLEKFPRLLTQEEKEECQKIIKAIAGRAKARKRR
ncbi:MAG: nucleotidyl cyclase domain-containing protein [Planctomycetota bacterium]|jgi:class 3 adenylate cyclase